MNRKKRKVYSILISFVLVLQTAFFSELVLAVGGGTVDTLTATYSQGSGIVAVTGTASNLQKEMVVIEIFTPQNALLYFGSATANEEGAFAQVIQLGSLAGGSYLVRAADYVGGSYKSTNFVVTIASQDTVDSTPNTQINPEVPSTNLPQVSNEITSSDLTSKAEVSISGVSATDHQVSVVIEEETIQEMLDELAVFEEKPKQFELAVESDETITSSEIEVTRGVMDSILDLGMESISLKSGVAAVSFPEEVLRQALSADEGSLRLEVSIVETEETFSEVNGEFQLRNVYDFNLFIGETRVSEFSSPLTVSVPYLIGDEEDPDNITVYYISDAGELTAVNPCSYNPETKEVVFSVYHFSKYAVSSRKVVFTDVPLNSWYYRAVNYLSARDITKGISKTQFAPESSLTRGQMVVLLMRAYGIQVRKGVENSFSDVGEQYYRDYIATAKGLGLVKGVGDGLFEPDRSITRQEMFVMMFEIANKLNLLGTKDSSRKISDLSDYQEIATWSKEAITSLYENGWMDGIEGMIQPTYTSTRAQMAQLLYKIMSSR